MKIRSCLRQRAFAAGTMLFLFVAQVVAAPAEYAIRWDPSRGGPGSGAAVAALLGLDVEKVKIYEVQYFDIRSSGDVSPLIARRRIRGDTTQLTLKSRSADAEATNGNSGAQCLLGGAAVMKSEVDITMLASDQVRRVSSLSCTLEGKHDLSFAPELHATAKGCVATMRRLRADDVEIEEWSVHGGASQLIEVSRKGADDAETRLRFATGIVGPLLGAKATPLTESKTEFVANCRP